MSPILRWVRRALFAALALGILYAGVWWGLGAWANRRLERSLEAIHAKGEPLVPAEAMLPPVPDAQNAAPLLVEAAGLLAEQTEEVREAQSRVNDTPYVADAATVAVLQAWTDANERAFEVLDRALRLPHCRFLTDGASAPAPEVRGVVEILDLLQALDARLLLAARTGQGKRALETSETLLRLGWLVSEEPMYVFQLMQGASQGFALRGVWVLLRRHRVAPTDLAHLAGTIANLPVPRTIRRTMLAERAYASAVFGESLRTTGTADLLLGFGGVGWGRQVLLWLFPSAMVRLDHARWLDLSTEALALADRPWPEVRNAWSEIERRGHDRPWYGLVSDTAAATAAFVTRKQAVLASQRTAFRIVLALERHEALEGALPPDLGDLDADAGALLDPASGLPFRYRLADGGLGYRLHGAGPDGHFEDDAAKRDGSFGPQTDDDTVFARRARP